ncbi:MAG: hypothetical protein ACXWCZ_12830, partial [Flavisolibacter sp.]
MTVLLSFATISQLAGHFDVNKLMLYNIYCFVDSIFWGYLFFRNSKNPLIRIVIILIILFQVIAFYLCSTGGIDRRFFSELVCLNNLVQLSYVLSFFYERYKREEIQALEKEPMFWFCLGLLIYAPTSYFLFAFYDVVSDNLWSIHHLVNTCMYVIFS